MSTQHKVITGDARNMSLAPDKSVHLVVTSPPYWQLKDYGTESQIGFDHSYEDYINNLNLVWSECHRVLNDGCRLCINIGDQFARSVYYGRYKVIPIRTEIVRFCETIGFDFMGSIVWQKTTTCNTTGGATIMGSYPYPRNGIIKIDYEHILLFKKHGKPPPISPDAKQQSVISKDDWNLYFNGHWNFPGAKQQDHVAMFPEELPRRLIRMFSFVGETVLDPFLGSGTTAYAAVRTQRNSVGYEINPDFLPIITAKLESATDLLNKANVEYVIDKSPPKKIEDSKLPYLFKDPLEFDKKVDPRKLGFGSRISHSGHVRSREQFFRVKAVLASDRIVLEGNLGVKLLGVQPLPECEDEAKAFLSEIVRGQQVYMKYDTIKHDPSNNLLAYLYLKNRTFINAHMLKKGYASLDEQYPIGNRTLLKFRS